VGKGLVGEGSYIGVAFICSPLVGAPLREASLCITSRHVKQIRVVYEKCIWSQWLNAPQAFDIGAKVTLPFVVAHNGAQCVGSLLEDTAVFAIGIKLWLDVGWVAVARIFISQIVVEGFRCAGQV